jgi:hypothetical protein
VGARLLSLIFVLLPACGGAADSGAADSGAADSGAADSGEDFPPQGRQHLRGFFVLGNELHAFQLCGQSALTWVELQGGEPGLEKLSAVGSLCDFPDGGPADCSNKFAYLEMDATVSGPCACGHSGKFERKLDINQIYLVSKTAPPTCPHVDPQYPQ